MCTISGMTFRAPPCTFVNWNSVVSVVTRLPRNRGSVLDRGGNFCPLESVGIGPGNHSAIALKDAKGCFRWGVKLTVPFGAEVKNGWS